MNIGQEQRAKVKKPKVNGSKAKAMEAAKGASGACKVVYVWGFIHRHNLEADDRMELASRDA